MFKTMFKIVFKIVFKTKFEKIKKRWLIKNMSFQKITDPKKRDFIVNEFLKTRHVRHVRNALTEDTAKLVGQALVSSRLDYANSIVYGMSRQNIKNFSARRTR